MMVESDLIRTDNQYSGQATQTANSLEFHV